MYMQLNHAVVQQKLTQDCKAIISSVQSLSRARLFEIPWTAACQASVHHQLPEFTQTHVH